MVGRISGGSRREGKGGSDQMMLKNKKTGEIHEITEAVFLHDMDKKFVIYSQTEGHNYAYKNLTELNAEWEDALEEPKDGWCIDYYDAVKVSHKYNALIKEAKLIGNFFETKEEAEKAVEKLKAWKRLKDKGFDIYSWEYEFTTADQPSQTIILRAIAIDYANEDLNLLFGGEE